MTAQQIRDAARFQVQASWDGINWIPQEPERWGDGMTHGSGDHWFTNHHKAWVAAVNLRRDKVLLGKVKIVARGTDGDVVGEQQIEIEEL